MSSSRLLIDPNGRKYSSDSFDRFGDDLSELLLSYLPIKDKFRLECVSKRWQRLVFNKVYLLDLRFLTEDMQKENRISKIFCKQRSYKRSKVDNQLKTLLQKCHNLMRLKLYVIPKTSRLLSLLSDKCPRLKAIQLVVTENIKPKEIIKLSNFGQTLGSKVEALDISCLSMKLILLYWCPNLKRLNCRSSTVWLFLVGNRLVPTLTSLSTVHVKSDQMPAFVQLVDKYEKTLKKIIVVFDNPDNTDLVFEQISRLKNLQFLKLSMQYNHITLDLTPKLIALGESCPKLSKISFTFFGNIDLSPPSKPSMALKSLDIYCYQMPNDFSAKIPELAPNLKEFKLNSECIYSNRHLTELSRLKHLKRLILRSYRLTTHPINDSRVIKLLENCKQLKELELRFRSKITTLTIHKLVELAYNRPKEKIRFSAKCSVNQWQAFRRLFIGVPDNLIVNVIK